MARRAGVQVALLNFDAGDMSAGFRGLAADPDHLEAVRGHIPRALEVARKCGCSRLNLLLGLRRRDLRWEHQHDLAVDNIQFAADLAIRQGATVLIEPLNSIDNSEYLITTSRDAVKLIDTVARENVFLQYDIYHMQLMEGNLAQTIELLRTRIGHIQVADVPGRNQPGTGEINFQFLLDKLARDAYEGYIGLEYRPLDGDTERSLAWIEEYGYERGDIGVSPPSD
jgi:hydroxypyruvate isomerase